MLGAEGDQVLGVARPHLADDEQARGPDAAHLGEGGEQERQPLLVPKFTGEAEHGFVWRDAQPLPERRVRGTGGEDAGVDGVWDDLHGFVPSQEHAHLPAQVRGGSGEDAGTLQRPQQAREVARGEHELVHVVAPGADGGGNAHGLGEGDGEEPGRRQVVPPHQVIALLRVQVAEHVERVLHGQVRAAEQPQPVERHTPREG